MRGFVLLCVVHHVHAGYTCPSGWLGQSGTPKCAGAVSSACSKESCCYQQKKCKDKSVAWVAAQIVNGGCRKGDSKHFFDLKKLETVVNGNSDADTKTACCTSYQNAKCRDWARGGCGFGFTFKPDANAPAASNSITLTSAKYKEYCCDKVDNPPTTCASFEAGWVVAQLGGGGCMQGGEKSFFDTNKRAAVVSGGTGADEGAIKAACCTKFSDAKCSNWQVLLGQCNLGFTFNPGSAAAPDNANGVTLGSKKYKELCCTPTPQYCRNFAVGWAVAQTAGGGCAESGAKKFFDLRKEAVKVTSSSEADIKAACCTPASAARCSDWMKSCTKSGTFMIPNKGAPGKDNGLTITQDSFNTQCCAVPMKCSDWTQETSHAHGSTFSIMFVIGALLLWQK